VEPLSRPVPPRSPGDRARAWIEWFGVARLLAASIATVIVSLGGYWLLQSPPPSTEATLPMAVSPSSEAPGVTIQAAPSPPSPPEAPTTILAHVTGAVMEPGVYELTGDARIRDALAAAGGPSPQADWNALNLAAPVVDGTRLYVPLVGEEAATAIVSAPAPAPASGSDALTAPVDVNRASAAELDALPGVGPATAAAIVTDRERNGPFVGVDDLERVPGIGPAKLAAIRDLVTT